MLRSALALAVLALAAAPHAAARIYNLSAPATVRSGDDVTAVLYNENYIQNWDDFGIVFGLLPAAINCTTCVGELVAYYNLYDNATYPPLSRNYTFTFPVPVSNGSYLLKAAVPHLVGASGVTLLNYFSTEITVT
ncbi:hypothetical protein Q5752_002855 [Cryptotrichosporon argae]